mmetsp:Transcript_68184/g.215695  ORF Transcript_68184/g.215695 Transcript_68184/m.215695 type:complete len:296 (-) Transcript_68184:232-1119(-)
MRSLSTVLTCSSSFREYTWRSRGQRKALPGAPPPPRSPVMHPEQNVCPQGRLMGWQSSSLQNTRRQTRQVSSSGTSKSICAQVPAGGDNEGILAGFVPLAGLLCVPLPFLPPPRLTFSFRSDRGVRFGAGDGACLTRGLGGAGVPAGGAGACRALPFTFLSPRDSPDLRLATSSEMSARIDGVLDRAMAALPSSLRAPGVAPPSRRRRTISTCPSSAARCNGVHPGPVLKSTGASWSSSRRTTAACPGTTALCSAIPMPSESTEMKRSRAVRSSPTALALPRRHALYSSLRSLAG